MKKFIIILTLSIFYFTNLSQAQSEDCNGYFAYEKGTKLELTSYDKKDKPSAVLKYEVLKNESDGNSTKIFFLSETHDEKGELLAKGDFSILCKDGQIYADVRNVSSAAIPTAANMKVDITGDKLLYPHNLTAGQSLPDCSMEIKSGLESGFVVLTINMNVTNRKVESFETVETPAGKFECVKITYDSESKTKLFKTTSTNIEYLAKGVGVVKTETFDKKGRKSSSMMLTKLER
jgi:hypothetical protein